MKKVYIYPLICFDELMILTITIYIPGAYRDTTDLAGHLEKARYETNPGG